MQECKSVKVPILVSVQLSMDQHPETKEEEEDMFFVPYASAVYSLMICNGITRTDITHAVGFLSKYMSKLGKEHWTTVKRVFRYLCGTMIMDCAMKEDQDWKEWWTYMALLMQTGLEIWITEDIQVGMCLTYFEEQLVG